MICPKCNCSLLNCGIAMLGETAICPQCWSDIHFAYLYYKMMVSYAALLNYRTPTWRDDFGKWLDSRPHGQVMAMSYGIGLTVFCLASFVLFAAGMYVSNLIKFGF